jgi:FMN phosphatase YigB (HAD superfamily)
MALAPRLITVDFFGTLVRRVRPRGEFLRDVLQKASPLLTSELPSAAAFSRSYRGAFKTKTADAPNFGKGQTGGSKAWWQDIMYQTMTGAGVPAKALQPIFKNVFEELYHDAHANWELLPTTPAAVSSLRTWCDYHGCHLAVVANMDERLNSMVSALGLSGSFDFVLSSYGCGAEKPAPEMFHKALDLARVPKYALAASVPVALHCGNSAMDDLHGALGAGFGAVLVDRRFEKLGPIQPMITEWQREAENTTRAWHSPHLGLAPGLLREPVPSN